MWHDEVEGQLEWSPYTKTTELTLYVHVHVHVYLVMIGNIHHQLTECIGRTTTVLHCPVEVDLDTPS